MREDARSSDDDYDGDAWWDFRLAEDHLGEQLELEERELEEREFMCRCGVLLPTYAENCPRCGACYTCG